MKYPLGFLLITALCSGALAQTASTPNSEANRPTGNSTVAYIYVSRTLSNGSANEVEAYAASAEGKLTAVSGSPFDEDVTNLTVSGKYLFATNSNKIDIDSYKIESDGAIHYQNSMNISRSSDDCGELGPLFFDRSGVSLYDMEVDGNGCANNTYELFSVHSSNGEIKAKGNKVANGWLALPATFIGNNIYAYSASCIQDMYWGIFGFKRSSSGELSELDNSPEPPTPPDGYFYCPSQTAADSSNHVAIVLQPVSQEDFSTDKAPQLASYSADSEGNLTTRSTEGNMPEASVGTVNDLSMSPSGKLLAVGGTDGLEVFHFNGSEPVTHFTGKLTKDQIDQFAWDSENHLYAISNHSGKLFVFTVTPTGYKESSGSPYKIDQPKNIAVQPEP